MQVLLTFDVELSPGVHQLGLDIEDNLAWFVFGACPEGAFGLTYELRRLSELGLKGVFFVDTLVAEVFGLDVVKRIVDPILNAGHDVQLHVHSEWLEHAVAHPVVSTHGANLADFTLADQIRLIERARAHLVAAGAPPPTAFRAGNFGANDDTLRALAALGIACDSSFNAAYVGRTCAISMPLDRLDPAVHMGVAEYPVSFIRDRPGNRRHAQLCALSSEEIHAALLHGHAMGQRVFTTVAHSVELVSRSRIRSNPTVIRRFEALLSFLAERRYDLPTASFADLVDADLSAASTARPLPANWPRTARRMIEQIVSDIRYEHSGPQRLAPAAVHPREAAVLADAV